MFAKRWRRGMMAVVGAATLATSFPTQAAVWNGEQRFQFATSAFQQVWQATDQQVSDGRVARSYTWGPRPWFDYRESYRQSPLGMRQVQYFDKSRMEINDPSNSTVSGVTNGLLTVELVSGRVKLGDGTGDDQNIQRSPATVPVAGDGASVNPNAPTYASFLGVATIDNGYRDPDRIGQRVGTRLDQLGNRSADGNLAKDPATENVVYNTVTGHNVPRVFRDFIQNGPVDGLFAFGYPISDAYWVRTRVGGLEQDVLVQLYERRVVTYTPTNPTAYKVEMGNVGQHYFQWRYPHLGQPWQPGAAQATPLAFASKRSSADHWETFIANSDGGNVTQVTSGREETVPYSWRRSFGPSLRLMTDSKRDRQLREVFSIDANDFRDVRQHTSTADKVFVFNAAISPDGTQIAAIRDYPNSTTITVFPFARDGRNYVPPAAPIEQNCAYQSPTWLPDGSGLIFAANCKGKFALYRANLRYDYTPNDDYSAASIVNIQQLTNTSNADNYFPRLSPDGKTIAFTSNRNGAGDVYLINIDGSGERRLTANPADDDAPTWGPDGNQLIFASNRDGDYELYRTSVANPDAVTQLTNNTVDDRWPLWFQ